MGLDAARRLEQTISTRNAKTRTVLELLFSVLGASSGRAHEAGAPLQLPHLQVKVHQECTNKTDVLLGGTPIFPHHYISSPVILPVCRLSEARTSSACSYMLKSKRRRRVSIIDANANTIAPTDVTVFYHTSAGVQCRTLEARPGRLAIAESFPF